jgi:uncharacterized repeat protein (TIGR02543 family)
MFRKLLSVVIAVTLLLTCSGFAVYADEDTTPALANPALCQVSGIPDAGIKSETSITFTATGDKQYSQSTTIGDTRYVPDSWTYSGTRLVPLNKEYDSIVDANNEELFNGKQSAELIPFAPGNYVLSVIFVLEKWTGSYWVSQYEYITVDTSVLVKGTVKFFSVMDGVDDVIKYYDKGSSFGKLPSLKKKGWKFLGFYTKEHSGEKILPNQKVKFVSGANEKELYAHWSTKVDVYFDSNGGDVKKSSKRVTYNDSYKKYGTLPKATRQGYRFAGWFTKKKGGKRIGASSLVKTYDWHTLYAHWTKNLYKGKGATVTLNEYRHIKIGMDYKEVCYIIGGKGYSISEGGSYGYYLTYVGWKGNSSAGSNLVVCFENGYVSSKSQIGLR